MFDWSINNELLAMKVKSLIIIRKTSSRLIIHYNTNDILPVGSCHVLNGVSRHSGVIPFIMIYESM